MAVPVSQFTPSLTVALPSSWIDQTPVSDLLCASTEYVTHINSFHPPGNVFKAETISTNVL